MKHYKNGTVRITIRNFGFRTDTPLREAVIEALAKDLVEEVIG